MLILYSSPTCPFCIRVKNYLDTSIIDYDERFIYEREEWMDELLESGGKKQVPFLVDTEAGVSMYESRDIIKYITEKYKN